MTLNGSTSRILRWGRVPGLLVAVSLALTATPAGAWVDLDEHASGPYNPHGAFVTDGSYVMNAGEVHVNITNWGLIGSWYSRATTFSDAPSAQWPAGSGNEYLYAAGLWVGGVLLGERLVSTGQFESEIRAQENPEDTIYEAIGSTLVRPAGNDIASGRRFPDVDPNDDEDYDDDGRPRIDEEVLNGYDDDDDGMVDEDFGQIGNQMMVTTLYDNTRLAAEFFPDHAPLNLRIVQETVQWENDQVDDFVGFQYTLTNVGVTDINAVYIGFFADSDIGPRGMGDTASDDMAGSFSGAQRASDGSWVPVEVGFMYDAAENNRLDGYFGIAFLGHDTDPAGIYAPKTVGLRTFQRFSGQAPFEQGGDPNNDTERYELLSADPADRDGDVQPGKQDDFRFLISAGPFEVLEPDRNLQFQVGIVMGSGRQGLLMNCAEAALTYYGNFFNVVPDMPSINDPSIEIGTGYLGRESIVCREDFGNPDDFNNLYPDFGDETCVDSQWLLGQEPIDQDQIFSFDDKSCTMINMDNCFECFRQKSHSPNESPENAACRGEDFMEGGVWNCNQQLAAWQQAGCTGLEGNETQVNWLVGMAPPPPGMRLWPTDNRVHVYWDNKSEVTPDIRLRQIDFESYRVWRADNWTRPFGSSLENGPGSNLWMLVAEYDVVDSFIVDYEIGPEETVSDTLPLGRNTGLESISYTPVILEDPTYDGLADSMQVVVDNDPNGVITSRPPVRDTNGDVNPYMEPVVYWEFYPDALDTFWAVAAREESTYVDDEGNEIPVIIGKDPTEYYEYVDYSVHNGFIYFFSITATDHALETIPGSDPPEYRITGAGQSGDPSSSFNNSSPATEAQTADERDQEGSNIFVYPNPATRDALEEFQELSASGDDPTGVRVKWANLPEAMNTISIYTLSGDLVETVNHDGTEGYGEAGWNLISRNGQEVVSGIYLYVVQSDDDRFEDFIGKFVVVR